MRSIATAIGLAIAGSAVSAETMFPVPADAEKPAHVLLSPGVAEQDYFFMKVPYPDTAVVAHYAKVFGNWVSCKPWNDGWESYADSANGANRFIHRFTRNWVSTDNHLAVSLLLQYESSGTASRPRPDNNNQFVAVLRHRVPDAKAFFADMRVQCPKAPNSRLLPDALGLPLYAAAHRAAKPGRSAD